MTTDEPESGEPGHSTRSSNDAASHDSVNPFLTYRARLDSYCRARAAGLSDAWFVDLVAGLDDRIASVWGHGFEQTPVQSAADLADELGLDNEIWIKSEAGNVAGSHKGRHLFGVVLHLCVRERTGDPAHGPLAISSCGNAALAAAVIARAIGRDLDVFVPHSTPAATAERIADFGAKVQRVQRKPDEVGDPCYRAFRSAVKGGSTPFGVQATDTPDTIDGGRTLGWELVDQIGRIDHLYPQVGGGAFATALASSVQNARCDPVQAEGCAPLRRAWDRLAPGFDWQTAASEPERFMVPWEPAPQSMADGLLDDITYDWLPLLQLTHSSGGEPVVATEHQIARAHQLGRASSQPPTSATGTAGLAGMIASPPAPDEKVALVFTGAEHRLGDIE